jgi:hypothetical protein
MHPRTIVRLLSAGRIFFGLSMLFAPKRTLRTWIGDDVESARTRMLIRSFGARDLALGLGPLMAMRRDAPVRGWVEAAAIGDLVDFTGTLLNLRRVPQLGAYRVLTSAAAAAAAGLWAAPRLAQEPADEPWQEPAAVSPMPD